MIRKFLVAVVSLAALVAPLSSYALTKQDCDANAVVWCGTATQADLSRVLTSGDGHNSAANIAGIYAQNSIQSGDIGSTVNGYVTRNGNVVVGSKVVATDAQSVGRQYMDGSTAQGSVWIRPTRVSFASDNLEAFVLMKNNQFVWAIIKACGNPVLAKPVVAVVTKTTKPTPPPQPPPPPPAPITTTVYVPNPVPTPVPAPQPVQQTPETGPVAGLAGIAAPAMWYGLVSYRKSRQTLRKSLLK
jgi:hypothetical protein